MSPFPHPPSKTQVLSRNAPAVTPSTVQSDAIQSAEAQATTSQTSQTVTSPTATPQTAVSEVAISGATVPEERLVRSPERAPIRPLWGAPPPVGKATEIAPGLWLLSVPLGSALDHINLYALEGEEGWTLVDTGINNPTCRQALTSALAQEPLRQRPVAHILATHFHPDHIGLAGELCQQGAELWTSRACWMQARCLTLDQRTGPLAHELDFMRKAGMKGLEFEAFRRRPSNGYRQSVLPLPDVYHRLKEGDALHIGDRTWTVHLGYGHAAEHITLWSDDGYVITGDQVLPGISSNISLLPSEPEEDVLAEWLESCDRFAQLASDEMLCLPGHNIPFYGLAQRCQQLIHSHALTLERLLKHLRQPRTVLDCLQEVYRRELQPHERGILIAETFGYLNHLYQTNRIARTVDLEGAYLWFEH